MWEWHGGSHACWQDMKSASTQQSWSHGWAFLSCTPNFTYKANIHYLNWRSNICVHHQIWNIHGWSTSVIFLNIIFLSFYHWYQEHFHRNKSKLICEDFISQTSTLVQVMAWCRQAGSHHLNQCWPWSMIQCWPRFIIRPQQVQSTTKWGSFSNAQNSRVSCQKGPTRHAYTWRVGPFWQDTLEITHESVISVW